MSNLENLLSSLMGADFNSVMACISADAASAKSHASKPRQGKKRRSPQERSFKAARKAVRECNIQALKRLVKTPAQANWYSSERAWCLLDEAVKSGSAAMVQWLLEKGANPNTLFFQDKPYDLSEGLESGLYYSPFASAIASGDKQLIQLMLTHGADIDLPVHYVKENIDVEEVEDQEEAYLTTCRELAQQHGIWPWIEGLIIGQAVGDGNAASAAKRL